MLLALAICATLFGRGAALAEEARYESQEWGYSFAPPAGQASYYFLFDYAFAAAAVRELPAEERATFRTALLEDILGARNADGSFVDMPGLGRAYGTGIALEALAGLRP